MMDRRQFLKTTAGATAATAIGAPAIVQAQGSGPIRIGLLAPLTGVVASGGREMVDGFTMFWEQQGGTLAGRKVEIVTEDDASNPDTALQKARRLVEQANVHFLCGDLLANTGIAVANYVKGNGVPYFIPIIAADDLTQRARIPNVIRIAGTRRAKPRIRSATGPGSRASRRSRPSARTTPSGTSSAAAWPMAHVVGRVHRPARGRVVEG